MSSFRSQHMTIPWHELVDSDSNIPAINAHLSEKASLIGRMGLMLLSVGAGAYRVRAAMNKLSRALNVVCNANIGLLSIEFTITCGQETYSGALSNRTMGVNTDKLYYLEFFADSFTERADRYSVEQFHTMLDKIGEMPGNYSPLNLGLAAAMACCAFTFLLGGGPIEMICAFFGAGIGNYIRKHLLEHHITLFANVAAAVISASLTYMILIRLAQHFFDFSAQHQAGYICSMLFVIPGFPLITGGIDLAKLDLRSGIERICYALLIITIATLSGWLISSIVGFAPQDFIDYTLDRKLEFALRLLASFIGVYGFSLMFNSPRRMAATAGLIGMIANTLRLSLIDFTKIPVVTAAFIGALSAGLMASAIKKFIGFPRITLTVASIVIMVPGMYMYKGIYFFVQNDISTGMMWISKAILIVLSLPLGLIFARILTDKNFRTSS